MPLAISWFLRSWRSRGRRVDARHSCLASRRSWAAATVSTSCSSVSATCGRGLTWSPRRCERCWFETDWRPRVSACRCASTRWRSKRKPATTTAISSCCGRWPSYIGSTRPARCGRCRRSRCAANSSRLSSSSKEPSSPLEPQRRWQQ